MNVLNGTIASSFVAKAERVGRSRLRGTTIALALLPMGPLMSEQHPKWVTFLFLRAFCNKCKPNTFISESYSQGYLQTSIGG